jgi:hypothetical protein
MTGTGITRSDGRLVSDWTDRLHRTERAAYFAARRLADAIEQRARTIGNSPAQLPTATERAADALRRLSSTAADLWTFYDITQRGQTRRPLAAPKSTD